MEAADPSRCPLCGDANRCALAAGGDDIAACWCASVSISPDVLARIPEPDRRQRCICSRCAGVVDKEPA